MCLGEKLRVPSLRTVTGVRSMQVCCLFSIATMCGVNMGRGRETLNLELSSMTDVQVAQGVRRPLSLFHRAIAAGNITSAQSMKT